VPERRLVEQRRERGQPPRRFDLLVVQQVSVVTSHGEAVTAVTLRWNASVTGTAPKHDDR
jgi:hypothetical protein